MEERKLNEAESLQRDCGTPFLIWGYLTAFISILQAALIYMLPEKSIPLAIYTWFILPVAGWIGMCRLCVLT